MRLGVAAGGLALVKTSRLFGGAPLALANVTFRVLTPGATAFEALLVKVRPHRGRRR